MNPSRIAALLIVLGFCTVAVLGWHLGRGGDPQACHLSMEVADVE